MQSAAIDTARLAKVLALTGSSHEEEALSAFRIARRQLASAGISLTDLLNKPSDDGGNRVSELERTLANLYQELERKNHELVDKDKTVIDLNRQISDLNMKLEVKDRETQGWRKRAWKFMWDRQKDQAANS